MVTDTLIGAVLTSLVFSTVVLGIFKWYPDGFVNEVSEGREPTPRTVRSAISFVLVIASILGGMIATTWWVASEHDVGFGGRFLVAWSVIVIGNVVDLVVLDIVIYTWISPSFMEVPGYPPMHDYRYHAVGAVKGSTIIGLPAALLVAAVTTGA